MVRGETTHYANPMTLSGLAILDAKDAPIEKYRYLSNLRYSNVNLFYRLLAKNVKVGME